ncbi:hypothetical protein MGAST_09355 [Mycobacterium gastri 'Wayne']|nr:hypothetical protein MGAST_09355 [Mycobacterium gastri 'Wayne']
MFQKPETPDPAFPKPEALPAPLLKKPEDGVMVEFPKPGVPAMLMGIVMGPTGPDTWRLSGISGIA